MGLKSVGKLRSYTAPVLKTLTHLRVDPAAIELLVVSWQSLASSTNLLNSEEVDNQNARQETDIKTAIAS